MRMLRDALNAPATFWLLLALPSIGMLWPVLTGTANYHRLVHPTGEFAGRFMIASMMITPLMLLFGRQRWTLWLMRRRRYLGVAAFGYAVLHTWFYLIDKGTISAALAEMLELGIWTGWVAFLIFVPLAATSNDASMRRLGPLWRKVQRWVYAAGVLTLVHWLAVSRGPGGAIAHFLPLALLEAYRLWHQLSRAVPARLASR